jgi:hypothetical protein
VLTFLKAWLKPAKRRAVAIRYRKPSAEKPMHAVSVATESTEETVPPAVETNETDPTDS